MIQRKSKTGNIFVISGPSGAGKNTLINALLKMDPKLVYSISVTTRAMRKGEIEGKSYFFITELEFKEKINKNQFLEWALVHGNYYGTLRSEIGKIIQKDKDAILDIDVQGALKIQQNIQRAVFIFVTPPSFQDLKTRLKKRDSETQQALALRLKNAREEIKHLKNFNFLVINDNLKKASEKLSLIIESFRMSTEHFQITLK